jgi:RNA polymerase-binding transcription factor DksA
MSIEQSVIQELKTQLETEKLRLEQELSRIANPTGTPGEYKTRFEDLGREEGDSETETEQYIDNIAIESTLEQKLQDVTEALARIHAGSYGTCEECRAEIALERLRAYPSAKICMNHNQ